MIFIHKYIKKIFFKKLFCILIHDPKTHKKKHNLKLK